MQLLNLHTYCVTFESTCQPPRYCAAFEPTYPTYFSVDDDNWGWCSQKCTTKTLQPGSLLETELTILEPEVCEKYFNKTEIDEGFDAESEVCAGSVVPKPK